MGTINAADMADRIVDAVDDAERSALSLLEHIFGREGDAALAAAVAYWGIAEWRGAPTDQEVKATTEALLRLLE